MKGLISLCPTESKSKDITNDRRFMILLIDPLTHALRRSLSMNNNNSRDNARTVTPRDPFSCDQIANIISYRIITANCSGLPLPTSLHTTTPLATPFASDPSLFHPLFLAFSLFLRQRVLQRLAPSVSLLHPRRSVLDAVTRCAIVRVSVQ